MNALAYLMELRERAGAEAVPPSGHKAHIAGKIRHLARMELLDSIVAALALMATNEASEAATLLQALEDVEAAIGDRLLARGPLAKPYAEAAHIRLREAKRIAEGRRGPPPPLTGPFQRDLNAVAKAAAEHTSVGPAILQLVRNTGEVLMALIHARTYVAATAASDSKAKALQLYERALEAAGWRPDGSMTETLARFFCPACGRTRSAQGFCQRCEERAAALGPEDES